MAQTKKATELAAIATNAGMKVECYDRAVIVHHQFVVERTGRTWHVEFTCEGRKKGWEVSFQAVSVVDGQHTAIYKIVPSDDFNDKLAHRFRRMNLPKAMKDQLQSLSDTIRALKN